MGKYKNLLLNIGLFTLNTVSTKLITFLLVPLYTYFLTAAQYGVTDMSLTVAGLITPVVTLSIGDATTRYVINDPDDKERYISVGFWITLLGCLIMLFLLPLLRLPVFGGLGNYQWFYLAYFVSSAFNTYMANVARGLNQVKLITWASIASSLVSASSAGLLIGLFDWKVEGYFISLILGGLVAIVIYLLFGGSWRYVSIPRIDRDRRFTKKMLLYSLPLMPNAIFWWIGTSVNRFFITSMLGIGASGLFAAASKIPNVMNMVSSTFWQAWSLSAFQEFKKVDTRKFYSNVFAVFRTFCFLAASGLVWLSPWLASLLLQKKFYDSWVIIPILILAFLLNVFAGFYGTVFTASMKTKYLMTSTAIPAIAVIVLTWLLINVAGLQGAAWAMDGSNLIMYVMRVFMASSIVKITVNWPFMLTNIIIVTFQACVMSWQVPMYMLLSGLLFVSVFVVSILDIYPVMMDLISVIKGRRSKREHAKHIRRTRI